MGTHMMNRLCGCALLALTLLIASPQKAYACEECTMWAEDVLEQMENHEDWMTDEWWEEHLKKDLEEYTTDIRDALMTNAIAFGSAMDSQNLMNTMRALEEENVKTMKNYAPSESICRFGTLSRSLALSENKAHTNRIVLNERSQDRQLGHDKFASEDGAQSDFNFRIAQFKKTYCDPSDFGSAMIALCSGAGDTRQNADINFTRSVESRNTLNVDFTDTAPTSDEEDIMALANNLYAHQVFDRINISALSSGKATDSQSAYLNQRAIVAKRSVAENSFNALVAQKAAGASTSKAYMLEVMKKLGLSDADADKYLGDKPSYDAQMEVLTKKIYQDPAFYANLMDSPANVNRQFAALQSFGLMQRRDIYETIMRSEMLLSVILEMEISKYQTDIQNRSGTSD